MSFPTPKTPSVIDDVVMRLCATIAPNASPVFVPVQPGMWELPRECFLNVRNEVNLNGGRIVFGWAIWRCANFFIEAEHHAVYEASPGAPYIDITPQPRGVDKVLFLPDEAAVYDFNGTDQTDNGRMSLSNDPRVQRVLDLFSMKTALLNSVPAIGGDVVFEGDAAIQWQLIEREIQRLTMAVTAPPLNIWQNR